MVPSFALDNGQHVSVVTFLGSRRVKSYLMAENTTSCPLCNKPFPMSTIEAHVNACLDTAGEQDKPAANPPAGELSKESSVDPEDKPALVRMDLSL